MGECKGIVVVATLKWKVKGKRMKLSQQEPVSIAKYKV
jgi:hypothetical protein